MALDNGKPCAQDRAASATGIWLAIRLTEEAPGTDMQAIQPAVSTHPGLVLAVVACMVLSGCDRHVDEPTPVPATVVMPSAPAPDAFSSATASDASAGASIPPGISVGATGTAPAAAPASGPTTGLIGGTLTVFSGTAPASASTDGGSTPTGTMSSGTSSGSTMLPSAGVPAVGGRFPTAGVIGPASAPSPEPPIMGTTR